MAVNTQLALRMEMSNNQRARSADADESAERQKETPTALANLEAILALVRRINPSTALSDVLSDMKEHNFSESYLQAGLRLNIELSNRLNVAETFIEIGVFEHNHGNEEGAATAFENARKYLGMVCAQSEPESIEKLMGPPAESIDSHRLGKSEPTTLAPKAPRLRPTGVVGSPRCKIQSLG